MHGEGKSSSVRSAARSFCSHSLDTGESSLCERLLNSTGGPIKPFRAFWPDTLTLMVLMRDREGHERSRLGHL